jgi:epoxyqueuosine reductase
MGDWIFGCDVCQDVCPWNRKVQPTSDPDFRADDDFDPLGLDELFFLNDDEFRQRFGRTPLARPRRRGLLRNAAIVLGNQRATSSIGALTRGLNDAEPLVRGASAWALGRFDTDAAKSVLLERLALESDPDVRAEIDAAVSGLPAK